MKMPLRTLLWELEKRYEQQPAFLFVENGQVRSVFYQDFLKDVFSQSAFYQNLPQERIGLWGYNSYQWIISAIGILLAGKHGIFFDSNLENQELVELARYADTERIVLDPELIEEEKDLIPFFPVQTYKKVSSCEKQGKMCQEKDFICFTSGTSRSSKGVVISTQALNTCVQMAEGVIPGCGGEKYFLPLPLYHIYGFTELFHILKRGGTVCLGRGGRYLVEDIRQLAPQIAFLVPTMLQYLLKQTEWPEQIYAVLTGGSWLRPELEREALEKGLQIYNLYGLTETLGMICSSAGKKGCRWLQPFGEIRFFIGADQEIGVFLPFHMEEYYKKAEDTRKVLDRKTHIFWTGDAGEIDAEGWVRIEGRIRDTIVLENGEKIHGEDTDRLLSALDGVKEGAVIQLHGGLGAVIVPEAGADKERIRSVIDNFNQERMVYMRIRKFWIRHEKLPRTATGKLRRFQLEQDYKE